GGREFAVQRKTKPQGYSPRCFPSAPKLEPGSAPQLRQPLGFIAASRPHHSIRHFGDPAADHGLTVTRAGLVGENAAVLALTLGPHPRRDRFARAHRTRKSDAQPRETGRVAIAEIVDHDSPRQTP